MKRAFTLIEVILTMVILSIVSYVASSLIAKTYIGYNRVNTLHKANLKVELALNNIANRLSYAIAGTIVKRRSATDSSIASISTAPFNYEVLEWIGYDIDGFEAQDRSNTINFIPKQTPAWSGFCNIDKSSAYSIATPGSDLNFEADIIKRLSNGSIVNLEGMAIFFPDNYSYRDIGYSGTTGGTFGIGIVKSFTPSLTLPKLNLDNTKNWKKRVTEHYKLAWSAYSIVPINNSNDGFDLELRYNYRPWMGEQYNTTRNRALLATNVTVFKTYATENRIHIKLCVKERLGFGNNNTTSICKEKVVFK